MKNNIVAGCPRIEKSIYENYEDRENIWNQIAEMFNSNEGYVDPTDMSTKPGSNLIQAEKRWVTVSSPKYVDREVENLTI